MTMPSDPAAHHVLFLCTGNSARSQIAEALVNHKGRGQWLAESAGSSPVATVNPSAIRVLRDHGIAWAGHQPRGLSGLEDRQWDLVVTVCDHARESCPIFPGQPVQVHWGMPDPASVEGDEKARRAAFESAFAGLERRIDELLALPIERLDRPVLERRLRAIGT
jgi:arsenate reductase (thioredoxin)